MRSFRVVLECYGAGQGDVGAIALTVPKYGLCGAIILILTFGAYAGDDGTD